jgi:RNA recognition motif
MNVYVGNLSRHLNEGELREAFAAFGDVASASIIKDKFSEAMRTARRPFRPSDRIICPTKLQPTGFRVIDTCPGPG